MDRPTATLRPASRRRRPPQAQGSGTEQTGAQPGSDSVSTDIGRAAFDLAVELRAAFGDRYALGRLLGRGGFGSVSVRMTGG
jgi:hypothetical protein